ncbi:MAG: YbaB/EbfC family nucleoid-associated protein [Bacteroidota bacterium]
MFGKFGDMMSKFKEMKERADEIKKALDARTFRVKGACGEIEMEMTGNRRILRLQIGEALKQGDKTHLENELVDVMNKALLQVEKIHDEEMKKAASGLLPGL